MATIRKRLGKWEVRVRRYSNKTISNTFIEKANAHKWAREVEGKIEKGLYEDLSHANAVTLKELLQQYCIQQYGLGACELPENELSREGYGSTWLRTYGANTNNISISSKND